MKFDIAIWDSVGCETYEVTTYRTTKESPPKEQIIESIKERVEVLLSENDIMPISFTFVGGSAFIKFNKTKHHESIKLFKH